MPRDIYQSWPFANDFTRYLTRIPAVTFPQLAATLPSEYKVKIFDGIVEKKKFGDYKNLIREFDIICMKVEAEVTALNSEINLRLIKEINPSAKVIMGGTHPTFFAQKWCEKGADIVVRREGEVTFPKVIHSLNNGDSLFEIKGITFSNRGEIISNPDQEFIPDLDKTPIPLFSLLNLKLYDLNLDRSGLTASVETARGCPYRCSFCPSTKMWEHTQRYKSVERVIYEIKHLYKLGVRQLAIVDESFGINYERDLKICESILKEDLKIKWGMFCRADTALNHPDLIQIAGRSGLRLVLVGFENTDIRILKEYEKGYKEEVVQDYKKVYEIFKKENILVMGLFVIGYPEENFRLGIKRVDFCDFASFSNLRPIPGTKIFEKLKRKKILVKDMFYHDRYLPSFDKKGFRIESKTLIYNLINNFQLRNIIKLISSNYAERAYLRNLYKSLFLNLVKISPQKIINFLIVMNPFISPQKRQEILVNRYIKDKFKDYEGIANKTTN